MPNTIDLYSPRTMGGVIQRLPMIGRFLLDTFFKNVTHYDTETVDFDLVKGGRPIAPFISYEGGAKVMKKEGYETKSVRFPLLGPSTVTSAANLLNRMPGEPLYGGMTPEERALSLLRKELGELSDSISRREEWMAAKTLFEGKIPLVGAGVKGEIDFKFTNTEDVSSSGAWDSEDSDPLLDLERWKSKVFVEGFLNCDVAILGTDAADRFLRHPLVKELFDNRRFELGRIEPKDLPRGVQYLGYLAKEGLDLYTYSEVYEEDKEGGEIELKPLVPKNKVLVGSGAMKSELAYGAYTLLDQRTDTWHTENASRIPDHWAAKSPDREMLAVYSRPLTLPHEVNAWFVGTVLSEE